MRFWDSSAIVPLCLAQPASASADALYREDPEMIVWWSSPVECASAFSRLARDGVLVRDAEEGARDILSELQDAWYEVQPTDRVRAQAMRLLRLHPLRAADAVQLAAALEWAGTPPAGTLISFDERLREAARREGFRIRGELP